VQVLWERYFEPMVRVAGARLRGTPCRAGGAEDVAVEAFLRFCKEVQRQGRFAGLSSRDSLLRLLFRFTFCEAADFRARETRRQRVLRGESALGEAGFALHAGREPLPEGQVQLAGLLAKLPEEKLQLRSIALLRLEGLRNDEIAAACNLCGALRKNGGLICPATRRCAFSARAAWGASTRRAVWLTMRRWRSSGCWAANSTGCPG
jgi:DNA-directed RNA polymerase specialized sigma24 family protein